MSVLFLYPARWVCGYATMPGWLQLALVLAPQHPRLLHLLGGVREQRGAAAGGQHGPANPDRQGLYGLHPLLGHRQQGQRGHSQAAPGRVGAGLGRENGDGGR